AAIGIDHPNSRKLSAKQTGTHFRAVEEIFRKRVGAELDVVQRHRLRSMPVESADIRYVDDRAEPDRALQREIPAADRFEIYLAGDRSRNRRNDRVSGLAAD